MLKFATEANSPDKKSVAEIGNPGIADELKVAWVPGQDYDRHVRPQCQRDFRGLSPVRCGDEGVARQRFRRDRSFHRRPVETLPIHIEGGRPLEKGTRKNCGS